jgi:hypothetical protein
VDAFGAPRLALLALSLTLPIKGELSSQLLLGGPVADS